MLITRVDFVELLASTPLTFPDKREPFPTIVLEFRWPNLFLLSAFLENLGEAFFGILSSLLLLLLPPSLLYSSAFHLFFIGRMRGGG